jgi:type IV pilus assembly protein PilO
MREWPWFAYVLVAVIILGLFYFMYYKPKDDELKNIREERIKVEGEVTLLRQKKQELDQIQAELERMKITLSRLEAIMPQKEEISAILRQMQQLAYDTRLNIIKFMPKEEIAKDFYAEKPISVEITGTYHNLAIFFDRLSNFRRLFNIDDFTIRALRDQTDASTISAAWTAKTYLFRQEPPPEKTTAQKPRGS